MPDDQNLLSFYTQRQSSLVRLQSFVNVRGLEANECSLSDIATNQDIFQFYMIAVKKIKYELGAN